MAASGEAHRSPAQGPLRVGVLGSGNWGSTIARIIGYNVRRAPMFVEQVKMYVYEEVVGGRKLTEIINSEHVNVKYLPGVKLPSNVVATPSAAEAAKGAQLLVFVAPHQFIPRICDTIKDFVAPGARAISLVKGFEFVDGDIELVTALITQKLGIECSVLSGANVAEDIAREQFSETTIGYASLESAKIWHRLFDTPYFRVSCVKDTVGVEICGALKNVVALAAGFCDGLGFGTNTKAAIIRIGMVEMRRFAHSFFFNVKDETFWDSTGLADLITACFGGRNRKCAEAFVKTGKPFAQLEREMLNGQKLQGTLTARGMFEFLKARGMTEQFPLHTTVHRIAHEGLPPQQIVGVFMSAEPRLFPLFTSRL